MVKIFVSSVIEAPIDDVWDVVRDFNGLPNWHPGITKSDIDDNLTPDTVGCIRNFYLQNGQNVRERLTALSDEEYSFSYAMLETGMGMFDYISTFTLRPITDGATCFIEWTADFTTAAGEETEKENMVTIDVFQGGFDALKARFNQ